MNNMNVRFVKQEHPATDTDIALLYSLELSSSALDEYARFLRISNGATLAPNVFRRGQREEFGIHYFLGTQEIIDSQRVFGSRWPRQYIQIAMGPTGDELLLSCKGPGADGHVAVVLHEEFCLEEGILDGLIRVADGFNQFLIELLPYEE